MQTYTVKSGDTLGKIARKFYGDAARFPLIVAANHIGNPDRLPIGSQLVIPDVGIAVTPPPSPVPVLTAVSSATSPTAKLNEQRFTQLCPSVATRGRAMVDLCAHAGLAILVTQGLRTWQEQDELYAKGRTVPPIGKQNVVTNAKGGQSYHNFGLAFDIVVLDSVGKADWDTSHPGWNTAATIGKSLGLEWGGDFKSIKDLPHYQYTGGLSLDRCRELFPAGFDGLWAEVTKGDQQSSSA
jgi:D-alanyl-D-alanine carboxypeptidase/LysM domain